MPLCCDTLNVSNLRPQQWPLLEIPPLQDDIPSHNFYKLLQLITSFTHKTSILPQNSNCQTFWSSHTTFLIASFISDILWQPSTITEILTKGTDYLKQVPTMSCWKLNKTQTRFKPIMRYQLQQKVLSWWNNTHWGLACSLDACCQTVSISARGCPTRVAAQGRLLGRNPATQPYTKTYAKTVAKQLHCHRKKWQSSCSHHSSVSLIRTIISNKVTLTQVSCNLLTLRDGQGH